MSNVSMIDGHIDENKITPEKAIKFFNEEIRRLEIAPKINGCKMTDEWAEQIEICKTAKSAIEKQIPKKVSNITQEYNGNYGECPNCKRVVCDFEDYQYCRSCGQAIDWSDTE